MFAVHSFFIALAMCSFSELKEFWLDWSTPSFLSLVLKILTIPFFIVNTALTIAFIPFIIVGLITCLIPVLKYIFFGITFVLVLVYELFFFAQRIHNRYCSTLLSSIFTFIMFSGDFFQGRQKTWEYTG